MDEAQLLVLELGSKGYSCAQMVLVGGLRLMGAENPALVRAMSGLAQGVGCSGGICGALTGGVCLIGLYTGKGTDAEDALPASLPLMESLITWFREDCCPGGDMSCDAILGLSKGAEGACRGMDPTRCGALVAAVWTRAVGLLVEAGIDPGCEREQT